MTATTVRERLGFAVPTVRSMVTAIAILGLVAVASLTGFDTPLPVVALGSITGITYGLLAAGLVLIYRSNGIINFAHGEIGAFAAAVFGLLAVQHGLPYYLLLPAGLAIGAGTGALSEIAVVRRLRSAPKLMSIVATLGIGQFLVVFGSTINSQATVGSIFPEPPGLPDFDLGALRVSPAYSGMLIFGPVLIVLLAAFLKYTRYGLAIRSAAANPDAARMAGIPAARMSSLSWALAGALSAFTAILTQPTRGFSPGETFGPSLLLRALAAAVLARMNSLPLAVAGGVALGVLEQLLLWNNPQAGLVEAVLFAIILGTLLLQKRRLGREHDKGSWTTVQALPPVPGVLRRLWVVRNLGWIAGACALAMAAVLPLFISHSSSVTMVAIFAFAIVGLSVGIVTGLGGQLSLGQFAVAAIGAWASYQVSSRIGQFAVSFFAAGLAGAAVSLVIGLPALRLKGLFLTVTTLSFALAVPAFLLQQSFMFSDGVRPGRPVVGNYALEGKLYYVFAIVVLTVAVLLARNVRRGGFGRLLTAVRDNEEAARAFTIRASLVKTQGFLLAGFLAGLGGALFAHVLALIGASTFPTSASIDVVSMSVVGGITVLGGPILGALLVIGVPAFLPLDSAGLAATKLGALLIILYLPSGLSALIAPVRDTLAKVLGRRAGIDVEGAYAETPTAVGSAGVTRVGGGAPPVAPAEGREPAGSSLLEVTGLVKRFGGLQAVRDVSFEVAPGETVGLIGPNGAGKTTTFELIGGFTKADGGTVVFEGRNITGTGPEARGQLGLIRSFQDAALFPTLTVEDTVRLALERTAPTPFFKAVLGLPTGERQRLERVREVIDFMGLERYRTSQVQQLSTGTRRIAELACLVALQPTLLLLDEPSSGIAQRETEALGQLLTELKEQLKVTLLIIEHDIPLIVGLSDRLIAMADGRVIAMGSPDSVCTHPAVVEAYLGGSLESIERSGATAAAGL